MGDHNFNVRLSSSCVFFGQYCCRCGQTRLSAIMKKTQQANLSFIEPMMALRVRDLPSCDWLYEMKFDGYRALAFKAGKEVRLLSRNRTISDDNYPQLIDALKLLPAKNVIIEGEIIALDQMEGLVFSSFDRRGGKRIPLVYVFDSQFSSL
jgi:bifunctional non-homologous end joining protein LigD